ncbi:hypothetical protein B0J13DRAFT_653302 [Dactylonectria estremocensis]|uniref:C2H2-type domain-containing protein n=1 Tax=Dactylonectria estremocensis TaxID=1079267 RepID=A0A9P9IE95_9HYPO|nr:hypothetical protein B0J13DRAFT_653302 [Dactylonectria estremocensis]
MEPFIHITEFPIVICKVCKFGCVANEVQGHIERKHTTITEEKANSIIKTVNEITGLIHSQAGLCNFPFPPPTIDPIPYIEPPKTNGLQCHTCDYVVRNVRKMQQHCRDKHGWQNDWKRGSNIKKKLKESRVFPWREGVHYQRFFKSHQASRWFEVGRAVKPPVQPSQKPEPNESVIERLMRIHRKQVERFNAAEEEEIKVADEKKEPNAWVERTGWNDHLQRFKAKKELLLFAAPIRDDELVLQIMCETFERVADRARAASVQRTVGLAALFQIERKDIYTKPSKPFDNRLEDESWAQYKGYWKILMCIWQRMEDQNDDKKPPYKLTVR